MSVFSERFDRTMKDRHYTIGMVAIKTGLARNTIQRYRTGERFPNGKNIFLVAKALNVDPKWLVGIEEEKK